MKRSSSETPSSPETPIEPTTPTKSPKKTKTSNGGTPKAPKTPKAAKVESNPNGLNSELGVWTAEKREALMDEVITAGFKALGVATLATKYEVSKIQMANAMQAGKKGNLRSKAVVAAGRE